MAMRGLAGPMIIGTLAASILVPTAAEAQRVNFGNFAGGLLGGAIAGAMMSAARPAPMVVYRRRAYRAPRTVVGARRRGPAPSTAVSVVNTAADPFATARPAAAATVPVSATP